MDVSNVANLATGLSNQKAAVNVNTEMAKIANTDAKIKGEGALQLIEAASKPSKPHGSLGHNINTTA